jgi:hypothetical protein
VRTLIGLLAVCFAGCAQHPGGIATSSPGRDYAAEFGRVANICDAKFPGDKLQKPITPRINCSLSGQVEIAASDPILSEVALANRVRMLDIAERYDAGKLSKERYEAEIALAEKDANKHLASLVSQVQSQQQAMAAADYQRRMSMIAAGAAMMSPPPSVTCRTFGNSTTCQ